MESTYILHKLGFVVTFERVIFQMLKKMKPTNLTGVILGAKYYQSYYKHKKRLVLAWNSSLNSSGIVPEII